MPLKMYRWKGPTAHDSIWSWDGKTVVCIVEGSNMSVYHTGYSFKWDRDPSGFEPQWQELDPFQAFVLETLAKEAGGA